MPRNMTVSDGIFSLREGSHILLDNCELWSCIKIAASRNPLTKSLKYSVGKSATIPSVVFSRNEGICHEGYELTITRDKILISYGDIQGAFYAMSTLAQLCETNGGDLPCVFIEDSPSFSTRGYMLDIGRNKVPKLSEIMNLIDLLASMKINHVELYMEGVPFEYPSFPHMWEGKEILSGEDVLALDEYCKERFIDLVPTQNNFGHMDKWLFEEYRHLAECPNGFEFDNNFFPHPRCLNPLDPESEKLVRTLADDLLPYFSSDKYNICCDETLELGQGASKEACEKNGLGTVYLDFFKKVAAVAQKHNKKILFWNDIIKAFPELLSKLPSNAIALEWGYTETQPAEESCELMQKMGVHYFVCPGTGAWNTMLGKTDQMISNIRNAAERGLKHGAEGLLNTDWGDCGHPQSIVTSLSGICYGAAMAWSPETNREIDLADVLNRLIFKDNANIMGQLVLDAGNYYKIEGVIPINITHSFLILTAGLEHFPLTENTKPEDYDRVSNYLDCISERLEKTELQCDRADLVLDEYRLAIKIIKLMQSIGKYQHAVRREDTETRIAELDILINGIPTAIEEFRRTWLERNKYSYLDDSLVYLNNILNQAIAKRNTL